MASPSGIRELLQAPTVGPAKQTFDKAACFGPLGEIAPSMERKVNPAINA